MNHLSIEIPKPISMQGWKEIPIEECGKLLVHLNSFAPNLILVKSGYAAQNIPGASLEQYCRSGVADRLIQAAQTLQVIKPMSRLLIEDAYRPKAVQQALFDAFKMKLRVKFPRWHETTLDLRTQRYVSKPSDDPKKPAPHITGGAIDLTIIEGDKEIGMGTEWDYFGTKAGTVYFERATRRPQTIYKDNRRLLYYCMTQSGFTNYPEEWWHFDYGNQFWAHISGQSPAIYGLIYPK